MFLQPDANNKLKSDITGPATTINSMHHQLQSKAAKVSSAR